MCATTVRRLIKPEVYLYDFVGCQFSSTNFFLFVRISMFTHSFYYTGYYTLCCFVRNSICEVTIFKWMVCMYVARYMNSINSEALTVYNTNQKPLSLLWCVNGPIQGCSIIIGSMSDWRALRNYHCTSIKFK